LNEEPSPSTTTSPNPSQKFEETNEKPSFSLRSQECLIAGLIIATITSVIFLPVIFRGLPSGHDAYVHYRWAVQFKEAVQEPGVFYPRWLASANHHQGSPAMLYYPPLPFLMTTTFSFLTKDMLQALAFSCWWAMFLSGLAMYVFCRSHFSHRLSLFAALFYLAAPYHLFDFYHRTALSELWAFVWVPLIFDALYRITRDKGWQATVYLTISYALLLFTHLPVAFALTLVLPVYVLLLTPKLKALVRVAAGLALGFGLSAIFTIPLLFERDYVKFQRLLGNKYDNNFLFESLVKTPLLQVTEHGEVDTLKLADWIAASLLVGFLFALFVLFFTRTRKIFSTQPAKTLIASGVVFAVALLMTTRVSSPVWKIIPQLPFMQFPFRWLTIASVCVVFLTCGAISFLTANPKARPLFIAGFLLLAFTLTISATVIVKAAYDREAILTGLALTEVKEYFPVWWDQPKRLEKQNLDEELPPAAVASGIADVTVSDDTGMNQAYEVKAISDVTLNFRALYFPGWVAYVDGEKRAVEPSDKGNIQLAVEAGEHHIALKFEDTAPRTFGKIISSICLLISLGAFTFGKSLRIAKQLS
jgi:uncharacterized membrane protein